MNFTSYLQANKAKSLKVDFDRLVIVTCVQA